MASELLPGPVLCLPLGMLSERVKLKKSDYDLPQNSTYQKSLFPHRLSIDGICCHIIYKHFHDDYVQSYRFRIG